MAGLTLLVGAHRAAADAATPTTTTTLTASSSSGIAGQPVTLTATVTGTGGAPVGIVDFFNNTSPTTRIQLDVVDGPVWLVPKGPNSPNTSVATWVWYPAFGDYNVTAVYTSTDTTNFQNSSSNPGLPFSTTSSVHNAHMDFTVTPGTIQGGDTVNLNAVVKREDGSAVTTGTVVFTSGDSANSSTQTTLGRVGLDANGVATLTDVGGWPKTGGTFTINASYTGESFDNPVGSSFTLVVTAAADTSVHTTTSVTATPSQVAAGKAITLVAHVSQIGNPTPPPGGANVDFRSTSVYGIDVDLGTAKLQADGTATLPVTFPYAADYAITGVYLGDIINHVVGSSGTTSVTVSGPRPTTTTYTGATRVNQGSTASLSARLFDIAGSAPIAGETVTLTIDTGSQSCHAVTDANGVASCDVVANDPSGGHVVHAAFAGDGNHLPSSDTGTLDVVAPDATSLTFNGTTDALGGAPATLSFVLRDTATNAIVAGQPVTISFNGKDYPLTTDAYGVASVGVTAPATAQPYTVGASFAGTTGYSSSTGSGKLTTHVLATTLTYAGDKAANGGGAATIGFVLTDANGKLLANQPVSLTINGATKTATTNDSGVATLPIVAPTVADTYKVDGSFAGATGYLATTGQGLLKVTMVPTTTTYNGDTQTVVGAQATLAATLVDQSTSAPLSGKTVTLHFGGETCSHTTDENGHASCQVIVADKPDSYPVTATFAGDAGHLDSAGSGTMVVGKATTTVSDNVSGTFLAGSPLTLSGTLFANGAPLAGKTLALGFGTASCSGVTNENGIATCTTTVPGPTGPADTAARFAGDDYYKPATPATGSALVYALAPGGGSFVVGDQTATGSVTFWGSQWWKQNVLSAGDAQSVDPSAFKGFAAAPGNPQCGGTWPTASGNSTPPPAGPLPAYMAVIVTSQNHKAPGPVISGNIVHVVVVKTDAGYDGNPGHDGTGTVVTTIC